MITDINLTLCIFLMHFYRLNLFIKKKKKHYECLIPNFLRQVCILNNL